MLDEPDVHLRRLFDGPRRSLGCVAQVSGLSELGADDLQPLGQDDRSVYSLVGSVKSVDHNVCLAIADGLVSVLLAKSRQLPVVGGQFTGS